MALKITDFEEDGLEDIALAVPARVTHRGCSDKANATITRTPLGWLMHCFKCDQRGFKYARVGKLPGGTTYVRPTGATLPADLYTWKKGNETDMRRFMDYGIDDKDVRTCPLAWSASMNRLMFPLYRIETDDVTGYYGLHTSKSWAGKAHPKSSGFCMKWQVFKDVSDKAFPLVFAHGYGKGHWDEKTIVVCEDPISALKIAGTGTGFAAVSLLGLSLPQEALVYFAHKKADIIVWSDGDPPGMKRGRGIYDQIKFLKPNTYFHYVKGMDPKDLTKEQIKAHIASIRKEVSSVA